MQRQRPKGKVQGDQNLVMLTHVLKMKYKQTISLHLMKAEKTNTSSVAGDE